MTEGNTMRKLYVTRKRALACFGLAYHCILGTSREEHLAWVKEQNREELMQDPGQAPVRNGETICLELGKEASSLFVIAYLEQRELMTQIIPIPAGTEDLWVSVVTDFDGNRRLSMRLVPGGSE